MGKIADSAKRFWKNWSGDGFKVFGETIDTEFEILKQEIQDLRKDFKKAIELRTMADKIRTPRPPPAPLPPEQWERGDVLSCVNYSTKQREVGIFHHLSGYNKRDGTADVRGYWQEPNGMISSVVGSRGLSTEKVTFEFRPEK